MENFGKFIFVVNSLIFTLLPTHAVLYQNAVVAAVVSPSSSPSIDQCSKELYDGFPEGPLVLCEFLDTRWIQCEQVDRLEITNTTKVNFLTVMRRDAHAFLYLKIHIGNRPF